MLVDFFDQLFWSDSIFYRFSSISYWTFFVFFILCWSFWISLFVNRCPFCCRKFFKLFTNASNQTINVFLWLIRNLFFLLVLLIIRMKNRVHESRTVLQVKSRSFSMMNCSRNKPILSHVIKNLFKISRNILLSV